MPNTNLLTLDEIAHRVEQAIYALQDTYPTIEITAELVEELTLNAVSKDSDVLALLVSDPTMGNTSISLDWVDSYDLSPFSAIRGVVVAEMQERFLPDLAEEEKYG